MHFVNYIAINLKTLQNSEVLHQLLPRASFELQVQRLLRCNKHTKVYSEKKKSVYQCLSQNGFRIEMLPQLLSPGIYMHAQLHNTKFFTLLSKKDSKTFTNEIDSKTDILKNLVAALQALLHNNDRYAVTLKNVHYYKCAIFDLFC